MFPAQLSNINDDELTTHICNFIDPLQESSRFGIDIYTVPPNCSGEISEFGVPAVNHKIACDWERVGIKSACFKLLRVEFIDNRRVLIKKIAGTRVYVRK